MSDQPLVLAWARAFLLTLVVECLIATPLLRASCERPARRFASVVLGQFVTHPAVWFILPSLGWSRPVYMTVAEFWAFAGEVVVYVIVLPRVTWRQASVASFVANSLSFGLGLALAALGIR